MNAHFLQLHFLHRTISLAASIVRFVRAKEVVSELNDVDVCRPLLAHRLRARVRSGSASILPLDNAVRAGSRNFVADELGVVVVLRLRTEVRDRVVSSVFGVDRAALQNHKH